MMNAQPKRTRVNSESKIIRLAPESVRDQLAWIETIERAVIGCVFLRPELYPVLSNIIQSADFYYLRYGWLWWAFEQVYPRIDQITVLNALKAQEGEMDGEGWEDKVWYVNKFLADAPDVNNAEQYAQMVREDAIARRVFEASELIQSAMLDRKQPLEQRLDTCNQLLFKATEQRVEADSSIKALVSQMFDEFEHGIPVAGVPTGFSNLTEMLKQFYPGEVILLAGHPGMGKTAMLLSIVRKIVQEDKRVVLFTMEQTKSEVVRLLVGMEGLIARSSLLEGKLTDFERAQFVSASSRMYKWQLDIIDEFSALTPTQLRRKLRLLSREKPIDLVVLDGLWLMQLDQPGPKRYEDVNEITIELVNIAKREFCVPILLSHQYNQDAKTREDKLPIINDIADGTACQRNLQLILAMHRDTYYDKESTNDITRLFNLKDRLRGHQGMVADFVYRHGRFEEA